jgi:hypothetical protein
VKKATPRQRQSNLLQVVTQWKSETSLREGVEFFPGKCFRILYQPADFQTPIRQSDFRFDAEIENGKPLGEMLARRKAVGRAESAPASGSYEPTARRDGLVSKPVGRFFLGRHFARPTFLALDQARIGRGHGRNLTADYADCADNPTKILKR